LLGGELSEGKTESWDEEEWVIAEAVCAARGVEDFTFDEALGSEKDLTVAGEGECADEAGGAVDPGRSAGEGFEEQRIVAGVAHSAGMEIIPGVVSVAGGADARLVGERGDFEAGVVGEDEQAGRRERVSAGLEFSVAHEGGRVFDGLRESGEIW
jgi:hypothetical protein